MDMMIPCASSDDLRTRLNRPYAEDIVISLKKGVTPCCFECSALAALRFLTCVEPKTGLRHCIPRLSRVQHSRTRRSTLHYRHEM